MIGPTLCTERMLTQWSRLDMAPVDMVHIIPTVQSAAEHNMILTEGNPLFYIVENNICSWFNYCINKMRMSLA